MQRWWRAYRRWKSIELIVDEGVEDVVDGIQMPKG